MIKNLILTADDFGAENFIDRGIIKGIKAGTVSCVSCFVNFGERSINNSQNKYEGSLVAIKALHAAFPNIGIGLHLNLSAGFPLEEHSQLTDSSGCFHSINKMSFEIPVAEVEKEINAQINVFSSLGIPMDHISCHNGVIDIVEEYREALMNIAPKGVAFRNPRLISTHPDFKKRDGFGRSRMFTTGILTGLKRILFGQGKGAISTVFDKLKNEYELKIRSNKIPIPNYFIDTFYGFASERRMRKIVENGPDNSNEISELVLHLGIDDPTQINKAMNGITRRYAEKRRPKELKTMTSAKTKKLLGQVNLISFKDIPRN